MLIIRSVFIFLLISSIPVYSRAEATDSLLKVLAKTGKDTNRVIILNKLANNLGRGNFNECLAYAKEALELAESLNFDKGAQRALNVTGNIYDDIGNYTTALEFYLKALRKAEEMNDKSALSAAYNNIGVNYFKLNNFEKALEYHLLSVKIKEELNNKKGLSASYINIGNVYNKMKDMDKSLDYYQRALALKEELGDRKGIAYAVNNIGNIYRTRKDFDKALDHYERSRQIKQELGDLKGVSMCLVNIGEIHRLRNDLEKALESFRESYDLASGINDFERAQEAAEGLAQTYGALKNYREAFRYSETLHAIKDSLFNKQNAEALAEMRALYETEKKEKEIAFLEKDNELQASEIRKKEIYIYFFSGGGLLVGIFSFFLFRAYRNKKRLSELLAAQKKEVQLQKEIVEEKNKSITDSINYAKRIQQAILPPDELLTKAFPESLVLFKPKDIVSGDFYWCSQKHDKVVIVAADCTGHGVPGALMSMIGNTLLNEIVNEKGITSPDEILYLLREGVIRSLQQTGSEGENKDGMDAALCVLSRDGTMEYAGANNPLWIIRKENNPESFIEIKADRQPIGIYRGTPRPFTKHKVVLHPGDSFYIFSDGYADQFGGKDGKKFRYRQMKDLLLSVNNKPMNEQKNILEHTLIDWQGNIEQVDDILVIGIRV